MWLPTKRVFWLHSLMPLANPSQYIHTDPWPKKNIIPFRYDTTWSRKMWNASAVSRIYAYGQTVSLDTGVFRAKVSLTMGVQMPNKVHIWICSISLFNVKTAWDLGVFKIGLVNRELKRNGYHLYVRRFPVAFTSIRKTRRFQHGISIDSKVRSALQATCQICFTSGTSWRRLMDCWK
jgi:hypothetical protein